MQDSTTFSVARQEVLARYAPAIVCPGAALMCVVAEASCEPAALDAIDKTAEALGYGAANVARVVVDDSACPLDAAALLEVVEGLDPVCVCVVGPTSAGLFAQAYGLEPREFARTTAFGRPVCLLAEMGRLVASDQGRQKAWALLKTLPVFPA